jgi:hypothetical protein
LASPGAVAPTILVKREVTMTTLSQFSQHERVSTALTALMALAIAALAFAFLPLS